MSPKIGNTERGIWITETIVFGFLAVTYFLVVGALWIWGILTPERQLTPEEKKAKQAGIEMEFKDIVRTPSKGTVVLFILQLSLLLSVAFGNLSISLGTEWEDIAISRMGKSIPLSGCTTHLMNEGDCTIMAQKLWYIIIFILFSASVSITFGFTPLTTTLHLIGTIFSAFGIAFASLLSFPSGQWLSWVFAVIGNFIVIGVMIYAYFDEASYQMFKGQRLKNEYFQLNPFYDNWWLLAATAFIGLLYLWYSVEFVIGPTMQGIYSIGTQSYILFASDFVLFVLGSIGLFLIWRLVDTKIADSTKKMKGYERIIKEKIKSSSLHPKKIRQQ